MKLELKLFIWINKPFGSGFTVPLGQFKVQFVYNYETPFIMLFSGTGKIILPNKLTFAKPGLLTGIMVQISQFYLYNLKFNSFAIKSFIKRYLILVTWHLFLNNRLSIRITIEYLIMSVNCFVLFKF